MTISERRMILCERCARSEATTSVASDGRLSEPRAVCDRCFDELREEARHEIVRRLHEHGPRRGEDFTYQPIDLPDFAGWRFQRPDSAARAAIMAGTVAELGLAADNGEARTYVDIGCNTGFFCDYFANLGFQAQGLDANENCIVVARMLDAYFQRPGNPNRPPVSYQVGDAYKFLRGSRDELVDVTSAFAVFQWVMVKQSVEAGKKCFDWIFNKTRYACFLEMGYGTERHYRERVPAEIDRDWVVSTMLRKGGFAEVRVIDAKRNGLTRDLFVGLKPPVALPEAGLPTAEAGGERAPDRGDGETAAHRQQIRVRAPGGAASSRAASGEDRGRSDGSEAPVARPPESEQLAEVQRSLREITQRAAELEGQLQRLRAAVETREYREQIQRIRAIVRTLLPGAARVIVVSRGDEALLNMSCEAWHFPRAEDGSYAGYYPADSAEAVEALEALRAQDGQFLLLPAGAFWWLDYYDGLSDHLDRNYRRLWSDETCMIYDLGRGPDPERPAGGRGVFIVSGVPGAGKTTVSRLLARTFPRGVHVQSDGVRTFMVAGGQGEDLPAHQVCLLADSYFQAGFTPVIDKFVTGSSLDYYIETVAARPLFFVTLLPRKDVAERRDAARPKSVFALWGHRDEVLRGEPVRRGLWIDSSEQTPGETVAEILAFAWSEAIVA